MGSTADEKAKSRAEALVGRTIDGRYQIDRVLATGAMGTVYLGRHLKLKKRVAIKALHPDVEDHPELVMRFEREAFAGAQVSHPNVARATDFGDLDDGTRYLVMEYVRGTHLRAVIDRDAPIAPERAVRIARQIAVALGHIHDRGIVHRDLKPRNVMLGDSDFVKVVDFGLAKIDGQRFSALPGDEAEEDSRLTAQGVIFGTVEYLAPEAAFGMELVDARADLYALGVITYEMLSGKHPFDATTDAGLFAKQRHAQAPAIGDRAPSVVVPPDLEAVVQKLLQKDFDERYQTAAEVVAAFDRAMPAAGDPPAEPHEPPPSTMAPSSSASPNSAQPPSSPSSSSSSSSPPSSSASSSVPSSSSQSHRDPKSPVRREPTSPRPRSRTFLWLLMTCGAAALVAYFTRSSPEQVATKPVPTTPIPSSRSVATTVEPEAMTAPSFPGPSAALAPSTEPPAADTAPSATNASTATQAVDVASFRERMRDDVRHDRYDDLEEATRALIEASPEASCDKDAGGALSGALSAVSKQKGTKVDEAWRAVALSKCGPDLLYAFVETGGKSAAATRATSLLRDATVIERASPAVKVAFVLHDGSCPEKLGTLERAVAEGDERAANAIDIQARGCARDPKLVNAALLRLRTRLETRRASDTKK